MIALVRIALSRPYTFVVLALLLMLIGPLAALRTPTDIFPDIRIPVIGVVWNYTGLPPDQMSGRITTPFQRALTTTVNDIEHIVANSYNGIGIIKIFFQPNVNIQTANAQVTAIAQTLIKQMPPGATPPLILNYSASTVPIIQVALSGEGLTGRIDCGGQGVKDTVSKDRLRGVRIFDITDITKPRNVGNVQTCRGSHTHTLLVDPKDAENVYVYISGSSGVRSPNELPGCVSADPSKDPNSALFRIEVIKVPLAHPEQAAIVSSPRIFNDLTAPARHGESPEDVAAYEEVAGDLLRELGYEVGV